MIVPTGVETENLHFAIEWDLQATIATIDILSQKLWICQIFCESSNFRLPVGVFCQCNEQ